MSGCECDDILFLTKSIRLTLGQALLKDSGIEMAPSDIIDPATGLHDCCTSGFKHEGTATGTEIKVDGVDVYHAQPTSESTRALVILTDVFGWRLINVRLIADAFAKQGYHVFIPDLFAGDALAHDYLDFIIKKSASVWECFWNVFRAYRLFLLGPWIAKHRDAQVMPIMQKVIPVLKSSHPTLKTWGSIGYCFGGRYAILCSALDAKDQLAFDAFAVAHPSNFKVPEDLMPIRTPSLFIFPEHEFVISDAGIQKAKEILENKAKPDVDGDKVPVPGEFMQFAGVKHGFAVRGNESNPVDVKARNDAFQGMSAFFAKYL